MRQLLWRKKFLFFLLLISFVLFAPFVKADQTISVTGTIAPKNTDFQLGTGASPSTTVNQDQTITYTITYGSHLYHADQLVIQADWGQGTISGTSASSVDGLDYVVGSSTKAYNNTSPVVDIINGKITWTIDAFSANTTNQTVSFQLKTNTSYTGTSTVTFPIKVHLSTPDFTSSEQLIVTTYQYNSTLITPTPTSIPQATVTPTPNISTPTPTPTGIFTPTPTTIPSPTPTISAIQFQDVSVRSLTSETISVHEATSQPTAITVQYGTNQNKLSLNTNNSSFSTEHEILLDNLLPQTTYYVQLIGTTKSGTTITSEIFSFTTAIKGAQPEINKDSVSFVSSDVVLYVGKPAKEGEAPPKPVLVIPQSTAYNFRFQVQQPKTIKRVQAILRNKHVLGITIGPTAFAEEPNTMSTDLIETQEGVYEGRLKTPNLPGNYEEFVRLSDTHGNIVEQKLADVNVSKPFRVHNGRTQQPIEGAQITLYYFNKRSQGFQVLPPQLFPVRNPSYTDLHGQIVFALPQGTYKANITTIGYKEQDITFILGNQSSQDYPSVSLQEEPFNIFTTIHYYLTIVNDFLTSTKNYVYDISYSVRFFELNALIATAILVFLTLLSFSSRIHIPLRYLFSYFVHFAKINAIQRKLGNTVKGRIFDKETGKEVTNAWVYLVEAEKETVLAHTISDKAGNFVFKTLPETGYDIQIMADGYEPTTFRESEIHAVDLGGYLLNIEKREKIPSIFDRTNIFFGKLLDIGFETLLVASLIFEIALGYALGWEKTVIFLVISVVNLFLWLTHLTHLRSEKNLF